MTQKARATSFGDIKDWFPMRQNHRDTNKGLYGHVLVLSGSAGFSGAPILVAEAAQRAGAGLVTLAIPSGLENIICSRLSPVIMTHTLSETRNTSFSHQAIEEALALSESVTAVALGPGIGLGSEVEEFVFEFVSRCKVPLVIDADALTILASNQSRAKLAIKSRKASTVMTPHPKEMSRLLKTTTEKIQSDRMKALQQALIEFQCVVVLKGSRTLISEPNGMIYTNSTGNPGLSSGGTGDALTGIIAGLLAQNLPASYAATAGAFIHGLAADFVATKNGGSIGMNAADVIQTLPQAIAQCQSTPSF